MSQVEVVFKGNVGEDLTLNPIEQGWGFSMKGVDGRTAFVDIGTRKEMSDEFSKGDDDPVLLVVDAVKANGCDMALEIIQDLFEKEYDLMLNGELIDFDVVQEIVSGKDIEL